MIDKIPMQIPEQFLSRILSGDLIRYGTIIKDASSGQIVGHLKEVGQFGMAMSQLPMSPLGFITEGVNLASNINQSIQLGKIQQAISALQVTANIGAVASVASLGVSAAGFAVVLASLKRVESKLDSVADKLQSIREVLNKIDLKWDALTTAKLIAASERLATAEVATIRRVDLLKEANSEFSRLRNYFYTLLSYLNPVYNAELQLEQVRDLLSRYFLAAMGQLHSEFLLNDIKAYRKTLSLIHEQSKSLTGFVVLDAYRTRSDSRPMLDTSFDHRQLMRKVKALKLYTTETVDRIETSHAELDFIEQNHLVPADYVDFLKQQESNLVLIPAKGA